MSQSTYSARHLMRVKMSNGDFTYISTCLCFPENLTV